MSDILRIFDISNKLSINFRLQFVNNYMKASPFLEQILYLVAQFLHKAKYEGIATQLEEHINLPVWVQQNNPLIKKGLAKIVKQFVKSQPHIQNYYQNRHPQSQEEEQEEIVVPKRKRSSDRLRKQKLPEAQKEVQTHTPKMKQTPKADVKEVNTKNQESSWMSKFQKPKRLEDIPHSKIENRKQQEEPKESKLKGKKEKKVKIESSDYQSEEDSFQLQPKKKLKKQAKIEKVQTKQKQKAKPAEPKQAKQEIKVVAKAIVEPRVEQQHNNSEGPKRFFSRINVNELQPIKNELQDNSFEAKAKYGQAADEWGKFGYEKLKDTRGESFKKTKGKLKNRAFQGSLMDVNLINSIPIL